MTAPFCPQYFIRAFLISTLSIASPGVSLRSAGCSLRSCAGWRARGAPAACEEPACSQMGFGPEPQWDKGSAPRAAQTRAAGLVPAACVCTAGCLIIAVPLQRQAGQGGESSWAAAIPQSTGSLSRAWLLALLSLRSNNFQIYSFRTEHLSKWV